VCDGNRASVKVVLVAAIILFYGRTCWLLLFIAARRNSVSRMARSAPQASTSHREESPTSSVSSEGYGLEPQYTEEEFQRIQQQQGGHEDDGDVCVWW